MTRKRPGNTDDDPPGAPESPNGESDGAPATELEASVRTGPRFPIVGVGASAGGLDALTELLQAMPPDTGMAVVVVQHLDPTHASLLSEILARVSAMPVHEVTDHMAVEPNHVYVIPPGWSMIIEGGELQLSKERRRQQSIDHFLRSLAHDGGHRAIGVILSGSASDGTLGLKEIKAQGGITFAQDSSAQVDSMPRSAVASGCVDYVLSPGDIARELARIVRHPYVRPAGGGRPPAAAGDQLQSILGIVRATTGVDFSHYKHNTLYRRIGRRMVLLKVEGLGEYLELLQGSPPEVEALHHDFLINVTSFFRDPEAFEFLKAQVLPRLTEGRSRDDPVRVWVLGCSTGEEAYSVAIAFAEYAEESGRNLPLQIFATDLDAGAIELARMGVYPKSIAHDVSPARLRRFFVDLDGHYRIAKSIRDVCVFARHNVLNSPPFSHIDLLTCRNLLIYLEPVLQQAVLPIMHYALEPHGYLWLGGSETIGSYRDLFQLEGGKHKFYRRKPLAVRPVDVTPPEPARAIREVGPSLPSLREASLTASNDVQKEAERLLMTRFLPPSVIVNSEFDVLHFRGDTGPYLMQPGGKPNLNLFKMLREGLLLPVRSALLEAQAQGTAVRKSGLRVKSDRDRRDLTVEVVPLKSQPGREGCFLVSFVEPAVASSDRSPVAESPADEPADGDETARVKQELIATRDYLQSVIEQHEATNEELQSANEEVQSANEELQSINEELETSKEEIQSTNEELATLNDELQDRNTELSHTNNDFVNLLSSVQMAIVMLGPDLRIRRITPIAERLLNLVSADVGRPITDIKLNIDVPDLEALLLEVMQTVAPRQVETRDRQGHWFALRARPYRTLDNRIDGVVLVLVDIDDMKQIETFLDQARMDLLVAGRDKDQFLAMLAHELRNPLAPLRNVGAVLKGGGLDPATVVWSSEVLERQIQTMTRMIDDLLDASRISQGKVRLRQERVDLAEVLQRLIAQVQPQLEKRSQRLTSELPGTPLFVWGDPVRLEQVFGNLLGNASKFSPDGGEIVIRAKVVDGAGAARRVVVSVTDSGIGLSPDMLEHAFDLFVQGDNSLARVHGGLGIGLTIARQLVELHDGSIRASSPGTGKGASFEVELPLFTGAAPKPAPAPDPAARRRAGPRRVLVVDDNLDAAESLVRVLRGEGHAVEQAHDAGQALLVADRFRPEICVLDIGLPKVDGYALAKRLRERQDSDSRLFLVAVSGYGRDADRRRSSEAGFDEHLVKPVEPGVMLELIARAPPPASAAE